MHSLHTIRHLDTPPTDADLTELRDFLTGDVIPTALEIPNMEAILFFMAEDRREMRSMSFFKTREEMLDAQGGPQHARNGKLLMEMLRVQRPQEHRHYQLLAAHNRGLPQSSA
jgi:hypothetical protein